MLKIMIGPNGFGKTTALKDKRKKLIDDGIDEKKILFLESEILILDEMKDTIDKSFAMEYIISELLENELITSKKEELSNAVDEAVNNSINLFNDMLDEVISLNGQSRKEDVIKVSNPKEYKKLVKIESKEFKNKLGSGQRMQFILSMVKNSSKEYIFLDEPEKHSHPSLLNLTAKLIRNLSNIKDVYIATHSPKLLEMLDYKLEDIEIYNDPNFNGPKYIDLTSAIANLPAGVNSVDLGLKSQTYYNSTQLEINIKEIHLKDFMESLFSKKVYLVEGINDELFIKEMLKQHNKKFDDYYIFRCFGKQHYFPFIAIFESLGIKTAIYFDEDDTSKTTNNNINSALLNYNSYKFVKDLEDELKYTGNKLNTVDFLTYVETLKIDVKYDI